MGLDIKIELNIKAYEEKLSDLEDLVKRSFVIGATEITGYISYIDTLVDRKLVDILVFSRLISMTALDMSATGDVFFAIKNKIISTADVKEAKEVDETVNAVLTGDAILFIDGYDLAFIISSKGFSSRGIPMAENESVVQGSKDAFSEVFRINTMLVRRRIKDPALKIIQLKVGRRSKTFVAVLYIEDIVKQDILNEALDRVKNIDVDAVMDSGYLAQLIEDDWISPFPQLQITERPDKTCSALLEGRVAIIVDNSPYAILAPSTLNTFFHSSEDLNDKWQIMSFLRALRYIAAIIAICAPGLYIATAVYHPSMLPLMIVFKMAESRQAVPFPAVVEILIMDTAIELLREAGLRLPGSIGGTIGIVGGLIVGQAAVEAGIVSPIVVIIIALTSISSFAIPQYSLSSGFRISKYLLIFTSAAFGLFGFWIGLFLIIIHLCSLKSFGIPYMMPFVSSELNNYSDLKDSIIRMPVFLMKKRPFFANKDQRNRLQINKTGNKKETE